MSSAHRIDFGNRGDALWAYSVGITRASLCTSMPIDDAIAELNRRIEEHVQGCAPWKLANEPFDDGHSNPCQCSDSLTHRHYLLSC